MIRDHQHGSGASRAPGRQAQGRALLVAAAAGLVLVGCGHPPAPQATSSSTDQLGSLEASVDAIAGQVDSDSAG